MIKLLEEGVPNIVHGCMQAAYVDAVSRNRGSACTSGTGIVTTQFGSMRDESNENETRLLSERGLIRYLLATIPQAMRPR